MRRKHLLIGAGLGLAGFVLAYSAWLYCHQPARFTEDMAARIRPGMTEAEEVAILGKPPGDYSSPGTLYFADTMGYMVEPEGWPLPGGNIHKGWISDAGAICVEFDPDRRVVRCFWHAAYVL
jgi:hypothetical protein